jgi:uncharacterized protein (TIGR00369 family)
MQSSYWRPFPYRHPADNMLSATFCQSAGGFNGAPTMSTNEIVFDRFPKPPCAVLLGWTLLDHDAAKGWIKLAFEGPPEFVNPAGFIQGGMLAAMLDDTMGPAVLLMTEGRFYTVTIGLTVSFLAPAKPGRLIGEGNVVQLGKSIAFVEASLADGNGVLVARASAQARLVPAERLAAA